MLPRRALTPPMLPRLPVGPGRGFGPRPPPPPPPASAPSSSVAASSRSTEPRRPPTTPAAGATARAPEGAEADSSPMSEICSRSTNLRVRGSARQLCEENAEPTVWWKRSCGERERTRPWSSESSCSSRELF